jgi:hypothetical protein
MPLSGDTDPCFDNKMLSYHLRQSNTLCGQSSNVSERRILQEQAQGGLQD